MKWKEAVSLFVKVLHMCTFTFWTFVYITIFAIVHPAQMIIAGMQVPTLDEIAKKEQSIKEAVNYKFNDKDIEDVSSCYTSVFCIQAVNKYALTECAIWNSNDLTPLTDSEREGQIPEGSTKLCHEENAAPKREGTIVVFSLNHLQHTLFFQFRKVLSWKSVELILHPLALYLIQQPYMIRCDTVGGPGAS